MSFTLIEGDVTLRSSGGVELATDNGVALVANARGFIGVGYDGANTRFVRVDSSGNQVIVGAGVAGTPAGGVLSVQGVSGGQALPISAAALPLPSGAATEATLATRATEATLSAIGSLLVTELDVALSTRASEATLASIKNTDGVKKITDPLPAGTNEIGKVAQGTPAAATAPWASRLSDGSAFYDAAKTGQLPVALVGGRLDTNVGAWLGATTPTVGQKAMAASIPVVVASNQAAMAVTFTPPNARTGVSSATISLGGSTSGSLQVMRATIYTEPAAAAQRSLASSSANDAAAGTGARTVKIRYFDGSGDGPFEETITLNGTTPVNTVATNIRFIEEMEVLTVGSNGSNVGTISLYGSTGGGGGVVGSIGVGNYIAGAGDNRTLWAHHYVPLGWTVELAVLVASIQSGGSGTVGRFFLRHANPLVSDSAEVVVGGTLLLQGMFERTYQFHVKLAGFVRVTAYGVPGVNNATLQCSFDWSELPA